MAASNYPHGWHEYVRSHLRDTTGYVVAQSGTCLAIKDQETTGPLGRVPNRRFQALRQADLQTLRLPRSWFMGFILCPGDDFQAVLAWIKGLAKADHERVVLYMHPDFDQGTGAEQLRAAKLEDLRATAFKGSWKNFHQIYGSDYAWQVWADRR